MPEYRYNLEECMNCPMLTTCLAMGPPIIASNTVGAGWQRLCNTCNRLVLVRTRVGYEYERQIIPEKRSCCPVVVNAGYECPECHRGAVRSAIDLCDDIQEALNNLPSNSP